jgi:hypothetical protein
VCGLAIHRDPVSSSFPPGRSRSAAYQLTTRSSSKNTVCSWRIESAIEVVEGKELVKAFVSTPVTSESSHRSENGQTRKLRLRNWRWPSCRKTL